MTTMSQKRQQVAAQCSAVVHLATSLADIHSDYAKLFLNGAAVNLIDMVGDRTAAFMEILGDLLNGMDAVSEEDGKLDQVFAEAQRIWPQPKADANLIAPDLLEALEALVDDVQGVTDGGRLTRIEACRNARVAIAKARGQS